MTVTKPFLLSIFCSSIMRKKQKKPTQNIIIIIIIIIIIGAAVVVYPSVLNKRKYMYDMIIQVSFSGHYVRRICVYIHACIYLIQRRTRITKHSTELLNFVYHVL